MKKLLSVCLALIVVLTMSVTAFAATNGFVESPSINEAPEIIESENQDPNCEAEIIVTPYNERDELSDKEKETIEKAYDEIKNSKDITELNESIKEIAKNENIPVENLAVSDLFNIGYTEDGDHSEHKDFDIVLESESLRRFVGLLIYTENGWEYVEGAKVVNSEHLQFTTGKFGTYAIVVNFSKEVGPTTGDMDAWIYVALIAVCLVGLTVITIYTKKKKV